jgi:dihydrofolate synthase/folylpolyglutamate synthase
MEQTEFLKFYTDTPKYTHAPGLGVMNKLLSRLGDPQDALSCVHIAGTNGKGSCAAMTASVLQAAGYKTGLFTSPDLVNMTERISVNGVTITLSKLASITQTVKTACAGLDEPSFFEKITAAAFVYFSQQACDVVVLETGLGGRLDATNVIKKPILSILTPIGFDHTAQLGSTLSAIAGEKGGIIKPGCPVVSSPQEPEALAVLKTIAQANSAPFQEVDITKITYHTHTPSGQWFSYGNDREIFLPLLGAHQVQNACTVWEAMTVLGLSPAVLRQGLKSARWPCRFEYFPGTPPAILDGAHNAHGAKALATALRDYFPGVKFTFLLGVMADKDYPQMLAHLLPLGQRFVCLTPDSPRALPAQTLAEALSPAPTLVADSLFQALTMAQSFPEPFCACGSLYYVGQLRQRLTES